LGRSLALCSFLRPSVRQWKKIDAQTLTLKNLDFDASGLYYCEVSTDTPIFTKASNEEQLHIMRKWKIIIKRRIGERKIRRRKNVHTL
jgi:hypothetical protein